MKTIAKISVAVVALACLSQAALAATPGTYAGVGLGYGQQESSDYKDAVNKIPGLKATQNRGSVAGRVFAGYNFNQYIGVEGGYNYLGRQNVTVSTEKNVTPAYSTTVSNTLQSGDLVAKAYLPLSDTGFNLYALGGGAYVHSGVSATVNANGHGVTIAPNDASTNAVRPKYGVGVSFDVPNSPITTALEVSRVQGEGSDSNIPNVDTAMLTVSYNFG